MLPTVYKLRPAWVSDHNIFLLRFAEVWVLSVASVAVVVCALGAGKTREALFHSAGGAAGNCLRGLVGDFGVRVVQLLLLVTFVLLLALSHLTALAGLVVALASEVCEGGEVAIHQTVDLLTTLDFDGDGKADL